MPSSRNCEPHHRGAHEEGGALSAKRERESNKNSSFQCEFGCCSGALRIQLTKREYAFDERRVLPDGEDADSGCDGSARPPHHHRSARVFSHGRAPEQVEESRR